MSDSESLSTTPELLPPIAANSAETNDLPIRKYGWQPGQSGNPSGRPKSKIISDALREQLQQAIESGDMTQAEAIAKSMVNQAVKGRVDAATFVRDTTEGKPVQAVLVGHTLEEGTARRLADLAQALRIAQANDTP